MPKIALKCKEIWQKSDSTRGLLRGNSDSCPTEKIFVPLRTLRYVMLSGMIQELSQPRPASRRNLRN